MNISQVRKGFTLIELLVVLTILGLFAALLFPVFLKARENARQTVCVSNLRQIGLAIQMYQGDNNGVLPTQFSDAAGIVAGEQLKYDPLLPYERSPAIYHCPDAPYHVLGRQGAFGAVWLDYNYRVSDLLDSSTNMFPNGPGGMMKAEPMSVLVQDLNHGNGQTQVQIILRANGSISRVHQAQIILWQYFGGKWRLFSTSDLDPNRGAPWQVYPDEPWPPQFEK